MPGVSIVDLELEHALKRRHYIENAWYYLDRVRKACVEIDPECRVIVFGSFIKGGMRVDSDVDVLVITKQAEKAESRGRIFRLITKEIGYCIPFEIHIVTPLEFEAYSKLIGVYREV
jgi:predicted nucleotidyltransferase